MNAPVEQSFVGPVEEPVGGVVIGKMRLPYASTAFGDRMSPSNEDVPVTENEPEQLPNPESLPVPSGTFRQSCPTTTEHWF